MPLRQTRASLTDHFSSDFMDGFSIGYPSIKTQMKGERLVFVVFFFFSTCFISCTCDNSYKKLALRPVAKVNSRILSGKDFADQLADKLKIFNALMAKDPSHIRKVKEGVLRDFIFSSLVEDYAEQEKISITPEEVDREIQVYRLDYPDDLSLRRVLAQESLSFSDWKKKISYTLLEKKVFNHVSESTKNIDPTIEEIEEFYQKNKVSLFKRKERVYLRQIVLDDLTKAQTLKGSLSSSRFAEVAKKYSISPESKNGGLLGWVEFGTSDVFSKTFSLPLGTISPVLESPEGFHIFKVEKRLPPGFLTLEDSKALIIHTLKTQKQQVEFKTWLDKQLRASRVYRDKEFIDAFVVETRD